MKNKLLCIVFLIGQHQVLQNYEFRLFHIQVECVLKCTAKMELKSGDIPISDPLGYYSCYIFYRNIAERSGNTNFLSEMTIPSNSLIKYL